MTGLHDSYVGTTCDNIWRQYKLNRAIRLWPCKCLEVIGLHGFLFVEFDTSSSVICHVWLISICKTYFKTRSEIFRENDDCSHLIFAMY